MKKPTAKKKTVKSYRNGGDKAQPTFIPNQGGSNYRYVVMTESGKPKEVTKDEYKAYSGKKQVLRSTTSGAIEMPGTGGTHLKMKKGGVKKATPKMRKGGKKK